MRRMFAAAALTAAVLLGPARAASADGGPAVTVDPSTGLVDGQVVNVGWSGFEPGASVFISVCKRGATDTKFCGQPSGDPDQVVSDATGSGLIRYLLPMATFGRFTCNDENRCEIAVLQNQGDLTSGVIVPFTFASSIQGCPAAVVAPVAGEGSTSAAYTMYRWENAACKLASHLNVTYTNDNSFDGMTNWVGSNPNANFALTGVPLPGDQARQLTRSHREFSYAPLTLTALDVTFNIVDQEGHQLQHLVLTPQIVAEIATGELSTFDCPAGVSDDDCRTIYGGDPDIRRLNPGVDFPAGPVNFFVRSEHSATNLAFTSWLSATAPSIWTYGTTSVWPPPSPHQCLTCPGGALGEGNVLRAVAFPYFYSPQNVYIGVVDSTYAAIGHLPTAALANPGQPDTGVLPTAGSLASALSDATAGAGGILQPRWDTSNPSSYPLPVLTYAAVPTSKKWPNFTADDGKMLGAFLRYAVGDGQRNLAPGSYPLTDALAAQTTTVAGKIPTSEPATAPAPSGGGNPGGNGSGLGGGSGGTGSTGGGSGPSSSTHGPKPPDAAKTPALPLILTNVGGALSSSTSSAMVPALIALALIAALIGPSLMLVSRRASLPTLRRRGGAPPGG